MKSPETDVGRASPRSNAKPEKTAAHEIALAFDDNRLASLVFGHYDQNLARIERRLGVFATRQRQSGRHPRPARGLRTGAAGVADALRSARGSGRPPTRATSRARWRNRPTRGRCFPAEVEGPREAFGELRRAGAASCAPATPRRTAICARCASTNWCSPKGPAGTGKTWLAVGHAVSLLEQGVVERLVLSRPAVEAGERLGFLPGDMKDKVDPYLRPIYDALYDFMDGRMVERGLADRHDRDRAARLHARPHARQGGDPARRGAERHRHADEDVPDPPRRGFAHDGQRRSDPDRPRAGPDLRPRRGGRSC